MNLDDGSPLSELDSPNMLIAEDIYLAEITSSTNVRKSRNRNGGETSDSRSMLSRLSRKFAAHPMHAKTPLYEKSIIRKKKSQFGFKPSDDEVDSDYEIRSIDTRKSNENRKPDRFEKNGLMATRDSMTKEIVLSSSARKDIFKGSIAGTIASSIFSVDRSKTVEENGVDVSSEDTATPYWNLYSFIGAASLLSAISRIGLLPYEEGYFSGTIYTKNLIGPGPAFCYIILIVIATHLTSSLFSLSPSFRSTQLCCKGIWYLPVLVSAIEILQIQCLYKNHRHALLIFSLSNAVLSLIFLLNVIRQRRKSLNGIWHMETRHYIRFRDFLAAELFSTSQFLWSLLLLFITFNSYIAHVDSKQEKSEIIGGQQLALAMGSLIVLALIISVVFLLKKKGQPLAGFFITLQCLDLAISLTSPPDVSRYPNLSWIDPRVHPRTLKYASVTLAGFFSVATFVSLGCHLFSYSKTRHRLVDNAPTLNSSSAITRRTSEFLLRSVSSLTDETPRLARQV